MRRSVFYIIITVSSYSPQTSLMTSEYGKLKLVKLIKEQKVRKSRNFLSFRN